AERQGRHAHPVGRPGPGRRGLAGRGGGGRGHAGGRQGEELLALRAAVARAGEVVGGPQARFAARAGGGDRHRRLRVGPWRGRTSAGGSGPISAYHTARELKADETVR